MHTAVIYSVKGNVAEVELNRRECKNAINASMYRLLADTLKRAELDSEVRVILLRGQEDVFCAGNDLNDFANDATPNTNSALVLMDAIQGITKPIIAAVAGAAVGIGTTLLYHCDVVYAAENAKFAMPFVALGVCPEFGSSRLAPHSGGYRAAAEAILFAEPFDAEYALRAGLISRIVPLQSLFQYARERAEALAKMPFSAMQESKRLMKAHVFGDMTSLFREELAVFDALLLKDDARRAIAGFLSLKRS
ncbi:Enoyl-CoA hydratase/isomerase [Burkholderia sp. H160]|nr:Enoyl-CoA hydratase/isomerase [Burkholderia sp. H160]